MTDTELKIKQIQACGVTENNETQCECFLFGLTEDGLIFFTDNRSDFSDWKEADQLSAKNLHWAKQQKTKPF